MLSPKYVAVRALKSKSKDEVIRELQDIYLELGLSDIIQHDPDMFGMFLFPCKQLKCLTSKQF